MTETDTTQQPAEQPGDASEVKVVWPTLKINPRRVLGFDANRPLELRKGVPSLSDQHEQAPGGRLKFRTSGVAGARLVGKQQGTIVEGARMIRQRDIVGRGKFAVLNFGKRAAVDAAPQRDTDTEIKDLHSRAFLLYKEGKEFLDQAIALAQKGDPSVAWSKKSEAIRAWRDSMWSFDKVILLDPNHEKAITAKKNRDSLDKKIREAENLVFSAKATVAAASAAVAAKARESARAVAATAGRIRVDRTTPPAQVTATPVYSSAPAAAPAWAQAAAAPAAAQAGYGYPTQAGVQGTSTQRWRCPSCYQPIEPNWVVCTNCGTNLRQYRPVYY